ncbi:MAG: response regulator, partial [Alphaproteobacteria bacterium]|nr:response regulator [Alphaproteobacteria bacterium]
AQRFKGYEASEIVGQHFSRFYTEADRATGEPDKALAVAAREGRFEKEGWRVRKDGSRFWAHVVIDAIRDEQGEILGFAKITRDITERMETQRALDQAREALFQSQKMEAIGQLTGGVAHDFNNLLMAIMGGLELVQKRLPYDPRITPLLENAMQGAQRGAVLTQRMLAFARKQELKMAAVDVPTLVRGMMTFLDRAIGSTIEVSIRFPGGLPRAHTDPYQLESALMNLVVNARDAMPDGGTLTITASLHKVDAGGELAPGDYLRLSVADTGEGMDEATIARATEPFFTTKGVGKGTGLGLSMAQGVAAQSGGALTLTSRPGEGAQVDLWLPVIGGEPGSLSDTVVARPPLAGRKLRILAVDDDSLVLINTAAMLDDLGHEVIVASSGSEGLAALRSREDIDLIISDEVMPHMTGSQFAQAARRGHPGIPFIIATGYADLAATAADAPAVDLLRINKPFTQSLLAQRVAEAMSRRPTDTTSH